MIDLSKFKPGVTFRLADGCLRTIICNYNDKISTLDPTTGCVKCGWCDSIEELMGAIYGQNVEIVNHNIIDTKTDTGIYVLVSKSVLDEILTELKEIRKKIPSSSHCIL